LTAGPNLEVIVMPRLFAVMLGGNAPKSNTELHDVVFVAGERVEDTYHDLMDLWFGATDGLHIDSWIDLDVVDGHRVTLAADPPAGGKKLWFINLGAYRPGEFAELHANVFLVAATADEVKRRAKEHLLQGFESVHTDDLYEVDDCLQIGQVAGLHVHLEPTDQPDRQEPHNGWHPLPDDVIAAHMAQHGEQPLWRRGR
jgi:hypothetical protein